MIIFKDIFTGDELFTDTYKIEKINDGLITRVHAKMTTEKDNIDDSKFGANASAEEVMEECDTASKSGLDVVLANKLVDFGINKKNYGSHIKDYMKRLVEKVADADKFKAGAAKFVKENVLAKFDDLQFFTGETMSPDGMLIIASWNADGMSATLDFFTDGLVQEKV